MVNIKIIGIGNAGCRIISKMISESTKLDNKILIDFIGIHSNEVLDNYLINHKIRLSVDSNIGVQESLLSSLEENLGQIKKLLKGTNFAFVICGMGGTIGTLLSPKIAEVSRSLNISTIGIVTKPAIFEREHYKLRAKKGIDELKKNTDSLIILPTTEILKKQFTDIDGIKNSFKEMFSFLENYRIGLIKGEINIYINQLATTGNNEHNDQ